MAKHVSGVSQTIRALKAFSSKSLEGTARGLRIWGEETVTYAKDSHVPVETGNLRASGVAESKMEGDEPAVELSFGGQAPAGAYAIIVHEKVHKYLEVPANEKSKDLIPTVANEVKRSTGL